VAKVQNWTIEVNEEEEDNYEIKAQKRLNEICTSVKT
jgi:hypothetical protein